MLNSILMTRLSTHHLANQTIDILGTLYPFYFLVLILSINIVHMVLFVLLILQYPQPLLDVLLIPLFLTLLVV